VPRERVILHADVDAFFASVEQRDDPSLRGLPVVVGGGVVLAASYEARKFGVRGGMGGAKARRLCPQIVVAQPRFSAYVEASKAVFEIFRDTAPRVEGLGLEEAFLDITGLERISGTPAEIGVRLRGRVREQLALPISVGVAGTKLVAKMASRAAKPDGLLVVPRDGELAFLHALRVEQLWGVGEPTARKLHAHRLMTVGQVAELTEAALVAILGRASGRNLHALAHNRDRTPVRAGRRRGSVGAQHALGRRATTPEKLDATLVGLVDRVARRMRSGDHAGRTVILRLRFGDYVRATRSHTLPTATATTSTLLAAARMLLAASMPVIERRGVTLVGISVTNLVDVRAGIQLELPVDARGGLALDVALDEVRERFGAGTLTRAVHLGRDRSAGLLTEVDQPDQHLGIDEPAGRASPRGRPDERAGCDPRARPAPGRGQPAQPGGRSPTQ
jgi:DNA polymerase-4